MFYSRKIAAIVLSIFIMGSSGLEAKSRASDWAIVKAFKSLSFKQQLLDFAQLLQMQVTTTRSMFTQNAEDIEITFEVVDSNDPRIAENMRRQADTAAVTFMRVEGGKKVATIYLCNHIKYLEAGVQAYIIFHELAHAYDLTLWYRGNDDPDYVQDFHGYPCIQDEAREYIAEVNQQLGYPVEILSYEWYAEWKAIQFMKTRSSKEIRAVRNYLQKKRDQEKEEGISSYHYPPARLMLRWLA